MSFMSYKITTNNIKYNVYRYVNKVYIAHILSIIYYYYVLFVYLLYRIRKVFLFSNNNNNIESLSLTHFYYKTQTL